MSEPRPAASHVKSIAEHVEARFRAGRRVLSFAEFLELFDKHPVRYSRDASRYLRDVFEHYGKTTVQVQAGRDADADYEVNKVRLRRDTNFGAFLDRVAASGVTNDEYPYKLKADDAPGVEFLGADSAGKNVFSKAASDWRKRDEKSGQMTLSYRAADKGQKTVGGTFKLSVCSADNCQLEQQHVKATVAVK